MSLLIAGSVAIDTIRTPHGNASHQLGGSAVFAALSARHWVKPLLVSAIGADFPADLLTELQKSGLDLSTLTRDAGPSFRWEGTYDDALGTRETTGLDLGVMATAKLQTPDLSHIKYAMMGNYHPARELELIAKLPKNTFIATDTIHAWISYERAALTELFKKSTLITIDRDELFQFTEVKDETTGVKKLFDLGAAWVIIKYGKDGSRLYSSKGETAAWGVYDTIVKDTTGAGDTFLGTIMAHLAHVNRVDFATLLDGMRLGTAAASLTIEAFGVHSIIKATKAEIERRAQKVLKKA